jgi:O-antigen/teichoic acid export membrane protein
LRGADGVNAAAAQEPSSLERRAATGAVWSLVSFGGGQAVRFAGNLVLSRLLLEEHFGLMALVNVLLVGLQLFSDVGIGPSIVQSERGDERRFLDTAWSLQVGRGALLWVATWVCAAPFAALYGDARLAQILPIAGATALIAGFNATKLFTASRHLHLRALVLVELGAQLSAFGAMVLWAWFDPSVWALVAGGVVSALVRMALSHLALPGAGNRFTWDSSAARSLISFGRWIFLSTVLTFFVQQSDRLIFGKLIPLTLLGVYSMAVMLATQPTTAIGSLASQVLFPYLSRVQREGRDLGELFNRRREPLLALAGWVLSGLAAGGPVIVRLLYDDRWLEAGWIVQLLALAGWFSALEMTNGSFLLARGDSKLVAASGAAKLAAMLVFIPLGHHFAEFPGAVAGYAASDLVRYGVSLGAVSRRGAKSLALDARLTLLGAAACVAGALAAYFCADFPDGLGAAAVFVAVSLVWSPLAVRLWPQLRSTLRRDA